jgi:hypothetical protein
LDRAGLIGKIQVGVTTIYQGRQWLDTEGRRVSYKRGLALAIEAFRETQEHAISDLDLLIITEYTFLGQELEFCNSVDTKTWLDPLSGFSPRKGLEGFSHAVGGAGAKRSPGKPGPTAVGGRMRP